MDSWLLPVFLIAGVPKESRARLVEQLLPIALGPASQRLVIATISAKRQALTEQRIVEQAIKAAKFENVAALALFPELEAAFKRLPAADQAVLFPASPTGPRDSDTKPT
jgi:hypothetical protein